MPETIAQRELRNDNAKVIDAVASGETFVVTRNGVPVAELRPIRKAPRTFVPKPDLVAAVVDSGRSHRRRVADLLIAPTAHANGLALSTRNPDDFAGLTSLVAIIGV